MAHGDVPLIRPTSSVAANPYGVNGLQLTTYTPPPTASVVSGCVSGVGKNKRIENAITNGKDRGTVKDFNIGIWTGQWTPTYGGGSAGGYSFKAVTGHTPVTTSVKASDILPPCPVPPAEPIKVDATLTDLPQPANSFIPAFNSLPAPYCYTPGNVGTVCTRALENDYGASYAATMTVSPYHPATMNSIVNVKLAQGGNYVGRVVGVEYNATGYTVTKTLTLHKVLGYD
jgi:hypothetical protein